MAHELYENDNMISVRETPWHGLGLVLPDYPTTREAQELAGLTWTVRKEPIYYRTPQVDGMSRIICVPDNFAIVRNDNNQPLGLVGAQYEAYQNDQMFDFMDRFMKEANSKIETCGSLRNGKTVWALSQAGTAEYVKNDPINKFFLFKNSFDGTSMIQVCFTDIRVVCNNTLTAALRNANNVWNIRHTSSLNDQISEIETAILKQRAHAEAMKEAMVHLSRHTLTENQVKTAIVEIVLDDEKDVEDFLQPGANILEIASKHQLKVIDKVFELHESGSGSDIPGVRGTAYGVLQAATEYADHYKLVRPGERTAGEARFESIMMGSAHQFKTKAFDYCLKLAA